MIIIIMTMIVINKIQIFCNLSFYDYDDNYNYIDDDISSNNNDNNNNNNNNNTKIITITFIIKTISIPIIL